MQKTIFFFIFVLSCFFSFAQNAANWWYFGANAGLDFSSGSPVAVTNGQLNVAEGCASISDINGNLLFYTDGVTVYNSQHTAMSNGTGLMGCSLLSSTMGAIIVPAPTNTAQYYIFTTDCSENSMANGLRYSVVDMNLAGGLGDVVVASKNTLVQLAVCEKVTAVKNASQTGYWIVTHEKNGNGFYAYQLTSTGLNMTPVISNIGVSVTANGALNVVAGYLKTSHQGNKIAIAHPYIPNSVDYGITEIFDFDNNTGNITNPISFVNGETNRAYGLEFSPNDRYLYVSCPYSGANTYQIDLQAGTSAAVIASIITISSGNNIVGALQLAPDGKIYQARGNYSSLNAINNPNLGGTNCNYTTAAVSLGTNLSKIGLPSFVQSLTVPFFPNKQISLCQGDSLFLNLAGTNMQANYSYTWTGANGFSSTAFQDTIANVQVAASGQYTFTIYDNSSNIFFQDIISVIVSAASHDTVSVSICSGQNYSLPDGTIVSNSGVYPVNYQNMYGCDSTITTNLTVIPFTTNVSVNTDTLTADQNGASYQWINCNEHNMPIAGANNQTFIPTTNGSYAVIVSIAGCSDTSDCVTIANLSISTGTHLTTNISISPNPFSQTSTIEITPFIQNAQLVIYNLQGQKVRECTFFEQNFIFERGDLPNGMYFLQVSEKDKLISVSKIILGD